MQAQQPQDQVSLLAFRVEALERTVTGFNQQLNSYVRERENDLKLKMLQDEAKNIRTEVTSFKNDVHELETEVKALKDDLQKKDAAQRESQDRLQIRVLWGTVSVIITILGLVIAGYLTKIIP